MSGTENKQKDFTSQNQDKQGSVRHQNQLHGAPKGLVVFQIFCQTHSVC